MRAGRILTDEWRIVAGSLLAAAVLLGIFIAYGVCTP
jgi:hypothetical protein